jgi:predicted nucleic acid-binding protein
VEIFGRYANGNVKYGVLDEFAEADVYLQSLNLDFDDAVNALVARKWGKKHNWITQYDVRHSLTRI